MKKIRDIAIFAINIIFLTLISISILGATALFPDLFTKVSGWVVLISGLIWTIVVACVLSDYLRIHVLQSIHIVISNVYSHRKFFYIIAIVFTIVWQVLLVLTLSGRSGWDPAFLTEVATYKVADNSYFSVYPNLVFQLFINHFVWILTGQQSSKVLIIILNLLNIVMLDTALLFIYGTVKKMFNYRYVFVTVFLALLIIGLSPYVAIPYTDIIAFLLSSLATFMVVLLNYINSNKGKISVSILLGIVIVIAYMTKPSLIIFYVAISIVAVLFFSKQLFNRFIIPGLVILVTIGLSIAGLQYFMSEQNYIKINNELREPATHFIAMGMTGNGGFNGKDIQNDKTIETYKARNESNKKKIVKRLEAFGNVGSYQRFLFAKQINNTSDGSFAWGVEGNFLKPFDVKNNIGSKFIMKMYAKNGQARNNTFEFRFFSQLVWLMILVLCWFSAFINNRFSIILKLTIVGFMLFLLLFEGGRSRYVIQFLPFIIMTIPYGIMAIDNLKKKI